MANNLSAPQNAALNITLSTIERRANRAWHPLELAKAVKALREMAPFTMPEAATVALKLARQVTIF